MTVAERLTALPAAPPSIEEWEELLVRMEILPRALRVTMEEIPASGERTLATLAAALEREAEVSRWLAAASGEPDATPPALPSDPRDPVQIIDRLGSLRARSFAMLQRRGLAVWAWTAPAEGGTPTAYQMVTALVRADAATLADLREGRRLGTGAC